MPPPSIDGNKSEARRCRMSTTVGGPYVAADGRPRGVTAKRNYSVNEGRTGWRSALTVARSRRGLAPRIKSAAQVAKNAHTLMITAKVLIPVS